MFQILPPLSSQGGVDLAYQGCSHRGPCENFFASVVPLEAEEWELAPDGRCVTMLADVTDLSLTRMP